MEVFAKIFIDQFKFVSQYNRGNDNPAAIWMIVLGVIGFFCLVMVIDRTIVVYKSRINKKGYLLPLIAFLEKGEREKAVKLSDKMRISGSPFAEIIYRGLTAGEKSPHYTYDFAVHEATLEIYPKLRKRVNYVHLLQSMATLIGLAGTIFGLILAFDAVGGKNASESSQMLAAGISAAMATTVGGLFVAIPTLVAGTILSHKLEGLINKMDLYANNNLRKLIVK